MFTNELWNDPLGGAYEIEYAISMSDSDNEYITWTPGSAGDQQKWTISVWFKRKETDSEKYMMAYSASGSSYYLFGHRVNNQLVMDLQTEGVYFRSSGTSYGSTSTWMHLVIAADSTQGTAGNRIKWYIDGTQVTSWTTETQPAEDANITWINTAVPQQFADTGWTTGCNYYLADINFVDGSQLAPTEFGEDDGGTWTPIDPSVTYGSNGYRLEFKQTGTGQDASGIGADTSGNGNHFAQNNLGSANRVTDTPSNPA